MITQKLTRSILVGGTIAATLDILFAISFSAYNGLPPMGLLQLVASGALGKAAFDGGALTAALGLVLHFALSYIWATLLGVAAWHMPRLVCHPLLTGIVFGIVVFLTMRLVVKPLSAFPFPVTFKPLSSILDLLSHMFLFGTPIAIALSKAVRLRESSAV
jgi:uncharacterized membrane protein YagU involved in acid resistance